MEALPGAMLGGVAVESPRLDHARAARFLARLDSEIERLLRARESVPRAMAALLPCLAGEAGARGAFVRTFGEDLALADFRWPAGLELPEAETLLLRTGPEHRQTLVLDAAAGLVVAQPLDVAGEWFGQAALVAAPGAGPALAEQLAADLAVFCEKVDDLLFMARAARQKHRLTLRLGDALRHRVLSDGLQLAVRALVEDVPVDRLLLVSVPDGAHGAATHVRLFEDGALAIDTTAGRPVAHEAAILGEASAYLRSGDATLLERFGFADVREEVLIDGIRPSALVGKLAASSRSGALATWDRELLAVFASYIRQRVVDFNKEWRTLAASFRPEDVTRLLHVEDYERRYLEPRESTVAMLYADIAGFTRLSEQVLKEPERVAALIEAWSRDAVDLVWAHGGVFDKMVGDCVIALFGPPFYESEPGERLLAAIRCARQIRDMTRALPGRPGFEHLSGVPVGVATGINLARLFVGRFGPNANFTGFSRGMNNASRLQGCAIRDEILVMAESIESLPASHGLAFGPERQAKVKNVAEPLRFRPLE